MDDITICVATLQECPHNCKRRNIQPKKYSQSYANFSLDYMNENKECEAFIGYGKKYENIKLKIN